MRRSTYHRGLPGRCEQKRPGRREAETQKSQRQKTIGGGSQTNLLVLEHLPVEFPYSEVDGHFLSALDGASEEAMLKFLTHEWIALSGSVADPQEEIKDAVVGSHQADEKGCDGWEGEGTVREEGRDSKEADKSYREWSRKRCPLGGQCEATEESCSDDPGEVDALLSTSSETTKSAEQGKLRTEDHDAVSHYDSTLYDRKVVECAQ